MTPPTSILNSSTDKPLKGETIAILIAGGFNEQEMTKAQRALMETGATIKLVSPDNGLVQGWHDNVWGHYFAVEQQISQALAADYSTLLIPGGQRALDKLKGNPHTARFLKGFLMYGKPVTLMGDAVQMLAHVNMAEGKTVTGAASQEAAITAAGATWSNDEIVVHDNIMTCQTGSDERITAAIVQMVAHFMNIPDEFRMAA